MDSGRVDWLGGGGTATERGRTTSMPGQLGLGVERVDGSGSMRRMQGSASAPTSEARAAFRSAAGRQAEQGDGSAPYINRVSMDETRRRGNCNLDNEDDVVMRNDSAPRETAWKGLISNDISYVWNHGPKFGGGFDCRYCPLITRGGGATRFREHLGGIPGEVRICPNVPKNVRAAMRDSRDDARQKKREKTNRKLRLERDIMEGLYHGEGVINIEEDDAEQIQAALRETLRDKNISRAVERRRGSGSGVRVSLGKQSITAYFDKELSSNKVSMQPKISTVLNVESKDVLGQAWAKFFHAIDIAGMKANCPYFRMYCCGCERNWSAFALVHTKQRNRLLYDKLHKLVSVRYNLKIRVEEEQDPMRENDKQKEVDPCAMMMDTTMFDATNPMMKWLNEDEEHVVLDGVDAASAVFEQLRFLNSSRKASHLGRKDNGKKRKRVEEEEEDYNDSEDDEEENEELEFNDEDDDDIQEDGASQSDGGDSPMQVEKDLPSRVGNNNEVASDGSLVNRRSERVRQAKKVKEVTSLYN